MRWECPVRRHDVVSSQPERLLIPTLLRLPANPKAASTLALCRGSPKSLAGKILYFDSFERDFALS